MNFTLSKIPSRTAQPRTHGLTMMSDKGLSLKEAENILSVAAPYVDMVKLAFGTALMTPLIKEKIQLYQSCNLPVYFGGLLFEAFVIRNQYDDYLKMIESYRIS